MKSDLDLRANKFRHYSDRLEQLKRDNAIPLLIKTYESLVAKFRLPLNGLHPLIESETGYLNRSIDV